MSRKKGRYPVALSREVRDQQLASSGSNQLSGIVMTILGGGLGFATLVAMISELTSGTLSNLGGYVLVLPIAGALLWLGFHLVRGQRMDEDLREMEHAFVITPETLEFPAQGSRPAESWPLDETEVACKTGMLPRLELRCYGYRPRHYPPHTLKESTGQIRDRIEAAQRKLPERE